MAAHRCSQPVKQSTLKRGDTQGSNNSREHRPRARRRKRRPSPSGGVRDMERRRPGRVVEQQAVAAVVAQEEAHVASLRTAAVRHTATHS